MEIENYKMRIPCKFCKNETGSVSTKNGQNVVRCDACGKACYNAPNNEIDSSLSLRKIIPNKQKAEIFQRDGFKCLMCGNSAEKDKNLVLHIAHIISISDANQIKKTYGVPAEKWVNDSKNLFTCCEECNLSQGADSLIPKAAVFVSNVISKKNNQELNDE